jgi:uncharacterized protein (DUF302 family)
VSAASVAAFEVLTELAPSEAEAIVRKALADQGFGVITEIDVAATLEQKLGVKRSPLKILGACNPGFAHRALEVDASVSLLLPCNVVLEAHGTGTRVRAVDPRRLLDDARFADLADEVTGRLQAALAAVGDERAAP